MAFFIEIKVIPNSGKQKAFLDKSRQLKCYLKSTPEKGKANEELIKFLAKKLLITKNDISIISGKTTRKKKLKINSEITFDEFLKKLE